MSDLELLNQYTREKSQTAFATLVQRHVNLVYSAALRQIGSRPLAEEVSQSVFLDLARHAGDIRANQPVAAWLYVVTRRTAIDLRRKESRRQAREQIAVELAAMKAPPENWPKVEELIDEAMASLNDNERSAILLRYFENRSLQEVGRELGVSEDTAQKRVSRALERLRNFFAHREVPVTASSLALDLSTHAIAAAPPALGIAISSHACSGTLTLLKTTEAIVMTTVQKSALAAAIVLASGFGLYEATVVQRQRAALATLRVRSENIAAHGETLRHEKEAAFRRLEQAEAGIDALLASAPPTPTANDVAAMEQMKTWLAAVDRLKQTLRERPELAIPELALLDEKSWFNLAAQMPVDTDQNVRRALAQLRQQSENQLGSKIMAALGAFFKSGTTTLPATLDELLPFFDPPIAPALLARYEMLHTGSVVALSDREAGMGLVGVKSPVDIEYDTLFRTGTKGFSMESALNRTITDAQQQFAQANNGRKATAAIELKPYLKWAIDPAVLEKKLAPRPATVKP